MTVYEIVTAPKSAVPTEEKLRAALAKDKAGFTVENIDSDESTWTVRLAETPDFFKKKDEAEDAADGGADESTEPDGSEDSEDTGDEGDSDEKGDKGEKGDKKKDGGDPVAEVKAVIDQLTTLFTDLGGKVQDLQTAHDDKAQKLKDIGDTVGGEGGPGGLLDGPEGLGGDVGPVPGGGVKPPMPAKGLDGRKPGVPGPPGGGLPAFTNFQVATHPGVDDKGEKISLTAAANEMESDPEFANYEVVGMTENADGTFSAKLKLKA